MFAEEFPNEIIDVKAYAIFDSEPGLFTSLLLLFITPNVFLILSTDPNFGIFYAFDFDITTSDYSLISSFPRL